MLLYQSIRLVENWRALQSLKKSGQLARPEARAEFEQRMSQWQEQKADWMNRLQARPNNSPAR